MENPYSRAPLQVTLYDVPSGAPVRSYMLLGDVPRSVLEAARRGVPEGKHPGRVALPSRGPDGSRGRAESAWPATLWSKSDAATLQRFFGAGWRRLLTPRVGAALGPPCGASPSKAAAPAEADEARQARRAGGAEDATGARQRGLAADFGSLDDFDDVDIIIEEGDLGDDPSSLADLAAERRSRAPQSGASRDTDLADWDPRTIYTDVAAYPEDTFADLAAKIYAASGIPPYRQHLFYPAEEDDAADNSGEWERAIRTTYRVTVEGALVLADIRRLSADMRGDAADAVAGVPVDRRLEERKEDVRVDALDSFRTLEESPGVYVRRVFVADFATLLRARGDLMKKALTDRYQFGLLYYGAALKYWPTLSPEAFRLAVADSDALAAAFPLLDPPVKKVEDKLAAEKAIVGEVYAQSKAQQTRRTREEKKGGVAVTEASVSVEPRSAKTPVNIRSIFGWVAATHDLPALVARLPPDAMEDRRAPAVRGGRDYVVEKTHVSAANPRVAGVLERFLAHPPRRPGVSCAIAREGGGLGRVRPLTLGSQPQFVFLTVYDDGRYTVESSWREDDRVGFDEVIRQLSAAARPVIETINAMGAAALPLGGSLETPSDAAEGVSGRATVGSLTVSTFWPHALTTEGFRSMKARWREYEKAGIVGIRGLQQAGAYTFYFRKGITNYDPRAMERVAARGGREAGTISDGRQVVTNHYAYLTDPALAQRWQQVYAGRLVRICHRTTDLRIEIVGVGMEEFRRIQMYLFVFLDGLAYGPSRLTRGIVPPGRARPTEGRLRSLQERDPDLYDLKKFDEGATVYSVLCQGDRQPEMVAEEEVRSLRAEKKASALVKYWNFTEGRPSYYRCPSKRFPHLSFRAGEHPLGYCLPCCKKTQALPGSKAQTINRLCLQKHQIAEGEELGTAADDDPPAASRHVLSYGKSVPVGRISHIPRLLSDGLLYDTIAPPFAYRLLGVAQQTPTLPDAGFFFALAAALSLDPEDFVRDLADTAVAVQESYRSLASGGGAVFVSAEDLADAIVSTFLLDQSAAKALRFSPFEPGGAAAASWRSIVADLVSIRYDVDVATFVDEAGDGSPLFEASASAAARIRACGRRSSACEAPADVALLVTHPGGTYPLIAIEQKEFTRHARGRGPARRFFSSEYRGDEVPDRVVSTLCDMIATETAADFAECAGARAVFDLDFVTELAAAEGYRVLYRLINLRDMCYGVVLAPDPDRPHELVYFPVPYVVHFLAPASPGRGSAPTALYGPRPPGAYPPQALAKVLAAANRKSGAARGVRNRSALVPRARLVAAHARRASLGDKPLVGFVAEAVCDAAAGREEASVSGGVGAYFFHDPVAGRPAQLPWAAAEAEATLPYEMLAIDRAIYEAGGVPARSPLPPAKAALAEEGLYQHYLYRLFLAEFAALLREERGGETRQALKALFRKTRFSSPSSLASFRAELAQLLRGFPEDVDALRRLVTTLYARIGPAALQRALEEVFDATAFDFDRTTLHRLRALGEAPKVEAELRRLMRGRVELADSRSDPADAASSEGLMNLYVACSLPTQIRRPQCTHRRLRMPSDRYEEYVSVLASDILNPLKTATLGTMTAGVVDGSRFVTRPGERILIR